MNKEKALKNQGLEFREDIVIGGGQRVGNADDGLLFVFSCEE